jgi:hypothetical protein
MVAATKPNDATTADFSNHLRILLLRRSTSMSYGWFNVLVIGRARGAGSAGLGVLLEPDREGGIVAGDDGLAGSMDAADHELPCAALRRRDRERGLQRDERAGARAPITIDKLFDKTPF